MLPTSVPRRDPILTAVVLEYKNPDHVGDSLGPIIPSLTKTFEYGAMDKLNLFQDVNDTLSRYGEANEVGFGAEILAATMGNHGLRATIAREDVEDSDERFLSLAGESLTVLKQTLGNARELRQAAKVRAALVAASRTSDPGNWADRTSTYVDIVDQVKTKINTSLYSYDSAICPKQVYNVLERHPSLVSQWFDGNSGTKILKREQIMEVLGIKNLFVPDGRVTTARRPTKVAQGPGGTPIDGSLNRIWGNDFFLFRMAVGKPNRMAPGFFYQWRRQFDRALAGETQRVRTWELPQVGMGGAYVVQQEYQSLDMVFPEMGWGFVDVLT